MFFAAKPKGFFVEFSEVSTRIARTNGVTGALVVEELIECPTGDDAALAEIVQRFVPKNAPGGYLRAVCGTYPHRRVVRRVSIEPKRTKEADYLSELAANQFRIEPDKYTLALINASDGRDYDFAKAVVKDVVMCGMPTDEVISLQDDMLGRKVYPERLELGSVATLGALSDYLKTVDGRVPVLVLELGMTATHSFIVSSAGVDASRPIPVGLQDMVPVVQKELGLKDEEAARKLFFSNTFDFTGLGAALTRKLMKELQSSIGFHEVQTGQSIGHVICLDLPPKLDWLEGVLATQLGVSSLRLDLPRWLQARGVTVSDAAQAATPLNARWFGLFSLMAQYDAVVPPQEN